MWLARLDVWANAKPRRVRWSYLFVKWNLVAMGGAACCGMAIDEVKRGRPALGCGVVVFGFVPAIYRAIRDLWRRHRAT